MKWRAGDLPYGPDVIFTPVKLSRTGANSPKMSMLSAVAVVTDDHRSTVDSVNNQDVMCDTIQFHLLIEQDDAIVVSVSTVPLRRILLQNMQHVSPLVPLIQITPPRNIDCHVQIISR